MQGTISFKELQQWLTQELVLFSFCQCGNPLVSCWRTVYMCWCKWNFRANRRTVLFRAWRKKNGSQDHPWHTRLKRAEVRLLSESVAGSERVIVEVAPQFVGLRSVPRFFKMFLRVASLRGVWLQNQRAEWESEVLMSCQSLAASISSVHMCHDLWRMAKLLIRKSCQESWVKWF